MIITVKKLTAKLQSTIKIHI